MKHTQKIESSRENQHTAQHPPRYRVTGRTMPKNSPHRQTDRIRASSRPARTVRRHITPPAPEAPASARLIDRFNSWRLGFSVDADTVIKAIVISVLLLLFTILQTTLFTRFRPFGAIPDLMLPFIITVGIKEKERWGAVTALLAAFVIDAAGGTEIMLLPLLYVPSAFTVGILTTLRLRDSAAVAAVYTVISSALRGVITLIITVITMYGLTLPDAIIHIVLPEFAANLLFAAIPQIITRAALRPFHKTRAERTGAAPIT